jgi:phosphatidylserine synthase
MQLTLNRPKLITAVCVLGFIWIVFSFPAVFSPSIKKLGDWYPALFGIIVAFSFIAYIGVWHMKQWGVKLFLITFFVKQTLLVLINDISYVGLSLSILFGVVMLFFYKKMDVNL